MADYILTTRKVKEMGAFEVVSSVKGITNLTVNSILVVESYEDTNFDFATFLVGSASSVMFSKIAYVSSEPVSIVLEVMKVLKAFIIQDSTLVDTQEGIASLFSLLTDSSSDYTQDEIDELSNNLVVVDEFVSAALSAESKASQRVIASSWKSVMETVDKSITSDDLRNQIQEFLFLFVKRVSALDSELGRVTGELNNLRASRQSSFDDFGSYISYTYTGNAKVLVIKEHTPVKYLTSYVIAFNNWINNVYEIRSKVIIVDRDYPAVDFRYKDIPKADVDSIARKAASFVLAPVIYTKTPVHSVMTSLMEAEYSLYIILDRTYTSSNIVTGRGVKTAHAVSSRRIMRSLELNSTETILNEYGDATQLASIGFIESYPNDVNSRITVQQSAFEKGMRGLIGLLGYK